LDAAAVHVGAQVELEGLARLACLDDTLAGSRERLRDVVARQDVVPDGMLLSNTR